MNVGFIVVLAVGAGGCDETAKFQKIGLNPIFLVTYNSLFGQEEITQFRTIQISTQKQLRFNEKTSYFHLKKFISKKSIVSFLFTTKKQMKTKKGLDIKSE